MEKKWLVHHDGQTLGPYTVAQIKQLAAQGKILPTDRIWGQGTDFRNGILAEQAVDFQNLPKPAPAAKAPAAPAPQKGKPGPVMDPVLFGTSDANTAPKKAAAPAPKPKKASSHSAAKRAHSAPLMAIPVKESVQAPIPAIVMPEVPPLDAIPLPASVAAVHEEGISLNERYRRACAALSQWADRDDNVPLILDGDSETICTHPEVLQILHPFRDQPFEIIEKLVEHLDLMVQNRSSYYKALAEREDKMG